MSTLSKHERTLAIALESLGCSIIAAGIAVEVSTQASIGHIVITSGTLVALVGGMLFIKIFRKT